MTRAASSTVYGLTSKNDVVEILAARDGVYDVRSIDDPIDMTTTKSAEEVTILADAVTFEDAIRIKLLRLGMLP